MNTTGFHTLVFFDNVRLTTLTATRSLLTYSGRSRSCYAHKSHLFFILAPKTKREITVSLSALLYNFWLTFGLPARFLYDVLSDISRWYHSEKAYIAEAIGPQLVGFCRKWPTVSNPMGEACDHTIFKGVVNKWFASMGDVRSLSHPFLFVNAS